MTQNTPERIVEIIAGRADLDRNDDGTFSVTDGEGRSFLIEIKVHDVTEAA